MIKYDVDVLKVIYIEVFYSVAIAFYNNKKQIAPNNKQEGYGFLNIRILLLFNMINAEEI